jgi:hypothetical protein
LTSSNIEDNPNIPHDSLIEKNRRVSKDPTTNTEKLEIRDDSNLDAFEEFDGLVHINLEIYYQSLIFQ